MKVLEITTWYRRQNAVTVLCTQTYLSMR